MARTRPHRPPFLDAAAVRRGAGKRTAYVDASCDFVAVRELKLSGVPVAAGAPFDKTLVTERRLQQMYETRLIAATPDSIVSPKRPATGRPPPEAKPRGLARRPLTRAAA